MNRTLNPLLSDTRKGDLTRIAGSDFTQGDPVYGSACYLAKLGNNGGVPTVYSPASVADICLYIVMAAVAIGGQVPIETPDTGENIRLVARGTGNAGDRLILADVPVQGVISGTSNASPDVITTSAAHGLQVGDNITIQGVTGDTAVNVSGYVLTVPSTTTMTISLTAGGAAIAGNGAYVSGGIYFANVGDAGKVRSLTGSLAPTKPGRYFRAAIAEENFVDGQAVRARWFPGFDNVTSALNSITDNSGGTAATPSGGAVAVASIAAASTDTTAAQRTATENAFATLIAEINSLRSALETQGILT